MTRLPAVVREPLVRAGTGAFRLASRVRGERAIHNRGVALTGRLVVTGGAGTGVPLLDAPGSWDVHVRFSRSLGLPDRAPDILGLAVRVLDAGGPGAHQDVLLDSTLPAPWLRRLPVPGRDLLGALYGTLVAFDVGGRPLLVAARALPGQPPATSLSDLPVRVELALLVADPRGPWRQVGTLRTTDVLPSPDGRRLRFSPARTGAGLVPPALLTWRSRSYPATHVGPDA